MRLRVDPQKALKEFTDFSARLQKGGALLDKTRDRDVEIATTPKREVFRTDKTVLYRYEPTAKNRLVKDLFDRLGFRRVNETPDGASDWELDTASYQPRLTHIALETTEALHAAG